LALRTDQQRVCKGRPVPHGQGIYEEAKSFKVTFQFHETPETKHLSFGKAGSCHDGFVESGNEMSKSVVLVRVSQKKPSSGTETFIASIEQSVLDRHRKIVKCVNEEDAIVSVKGVFEEIRILKRHVVNMC
jgi:hypothetical protein